MLFDNLMKDRNTIVDYKITPMTTIITKERFGKKFQEIHDTRQLFILNINKPIYPNEAKT